jgi:hypothetical protein
MRPLDDRNLRNALHEEAERHVPDRDAMLARINRRRGSGRRGVMSLLFQPVGPGARRAMAVMRPAAAALAVAGVLIAGVSGINLANRAPQPGPQVAGPPAAAPAPTATPSDAPVTSVGPATHTTTAVPPTSPARPSSRRPTTTGQPSRPPPPPVEDGFLSATAVLDPHSIADWAQSNLTLATTETITALDVTVRVARTPGVADTGHWTSIPAELITSAMTATDAELVYRFTLNPGATLAPGDYTFAVQYNHATGDRPLTGDSYEATVSAPAAAKVTGRYTG